MKSLGPVAIVTGAGSGVRRASALALLRDCYSVALAGRRIDTLEASLAEAEEHRERAITVTIDVGDLELVRELFARTQEAFGGRLDVLFNNVGASSPSANMEDLIVLPSPSGGGLGWGRPPDCMRTGGQLGQ